MARDHRFLILHGLGNRRPRGHWQWWLAHELEQRGEHVHYPQLPDPDQPSLYRWLEAMMWEYSRMAEAERVVICHSLGCALWYQASARGLISPPADRLLLVAPPGPSELAKPATEEFWNGPWNAEVLAASCLTTIRLVASELDQYCIEGAAAIVYGLPLGLDAETISGAGHLDMIAGYGPWPQALRWCLDDRTRFSNGSRSDPLRGDLAPPNEEDSGGAEP